MCLSTVKKASAGYLDELPTSGNEGGRCFRDLEWEEKVLKICRESGVGAQFGGKYLVHDVRVIRAPRHAASCPVAIGVSCSADRNIKAKITPEGIFLGAAGEESRALPADRRRPPMSPAVDIDLDEGMDKVRAILTKYPIKTRLNLRGTLIVARDIAHARIKQMLDEGKPMPEYFKKHPVYYAGPAKTPQGMASGSFGPTTAGRIDTYVDLFQSQGGSLVMVAKGNRSQQVTDACRKHGGFYLGSIGGPAAILAKNSIKSVEVGGLPRTGHGGRAQDLCRELPGVHHRRRQGERLFRRFQALRTVVYTMHCFRSRLVLSPPAAPFANPASPQTPPSGRGLVAQAAKLAFRTAGVN